MTTTASPSTGKKLAKVTPPTAKKTAAPVKVKAQTKSAKTTSTRPSSVQKTALKNSAIPAPKSSSPVPKKPMPAAQADAIKSKTSTVKAKPAKDKKVKVMRDSFTIPKVEFNQIGELKKRAVAMGIEVKKSELIRAGLLLINGLTDAQFKLALSAVPTVKTGRPSKD